MTVKPFPHDLGWRWQMFSGRPLLVTDGGGAMVVMAGAHQSPLVTRDLETGMLRTLTPTDTVAKIIAAAPDVRRHARELIHGLSLGLVRIDPVDGGDRAFVDAIITNLCLAIAKTEAP